jgi:hypothetical protein
MVYVRPHHRRNPIAIGGWRRRRAPGHKKPPHLQTAYGYYRARIRRLGQPHRRRYGGYGPHYRRKTKGYVKVYHKPGPKPWKKYSRLGGYRARRYRRRR